MKSLLLDIDGVLVRDKVLAKHVKNNCERYVSRKLPVVKNYRELNQVLYLSYGHTARGLAKEFGIDTSDFTEKVYDDALLKHLAEVLVTDDFQKDAREIHGLCKDGWSVTLFSNSPECWAIRVALAISDELGVACPKQQFMKPEPVIYTQFPADVTHTFVDDSLKNLGTARLLSNWRPIHFDEKKSEEGLWCPQVASIQELSAHLRT